MNVLATLAKKKIISDEDIAAIEEEMRSSGESLEGVLRRRGVDASAVLEAKSEELALPFRKVI